MLVNPCHVRPGFTAHDLRVHRYFFRLFALDVDGLDLPAGFTAGDVFRGIYGHVLAEAST